MNLTLLVIGVLIGASSLTHFSFSQNYGPEEGNMLAKSFSFRMPNYSVYLYAITAPNTYTIHFDGNGSTAGEMENMDMTYDQERTLLANNFTRERYTFKGWSLTPEGDVEYSDEAEVKNLTPDNEGEVTLYAQRDGEAVPYTIAYYLEKLEGLGYDLAETGLEYGPAGPGIVVTGENFTGFTLLTGENFNITSGGIVQYHYTRNTYNFTVVDWDRDIVLIDSGVKFGYDIASILPEDPTWTGNQFEGWNTDMPNDRDWKMPAHDLEISVNWTIGKHSITFNTDGGSEIAPIIGNYGDPIRLPANPTKPGYEFVGWDNEIPATIPKYDIVVNAIWKQVDEQRGYSGGGGRRGGGDSGGDSQGEGEHGSAPVGQSSETIITKDRPSTEVLVAYMWAHSRGIIETSRQQSDPDGYVTRGAMAEMLVKFTENVIGVKAPSDIPEDCAWGDAESEWNSPNTKLYAQKACALGVMGIRMQNFMPNKILDRAEFGTILSRLLWKDKYDVVDATATRPYYTRHLAALQREGVMTQIEDPVTRQELRKWAWLMLMRVEKKIL